MDEFVGFNYLLLDASGGPAAQGVRVVEQCHQRERVDVIARQFRDFLKQQPPPRDAAAADDDPPRGMMMTHDFKVRARVTPPTGWMTFHVDRGDGSGERLERVALVVFAREDGGDEVRRVLGREAPAVAGRRLPAAPFAVAVLLAPKVPAIVREFLPKPAAGFFSTSY